MTSIRASSQMRGQGRSSREFIVSLWHNQSQLISEITDPMWSVKSWLLVWEAPRSAI
jgi:hypothetical protein